MNDGFARTNETLVRETRMARVAPNPTSATPRRSAALGGNRKFSDVGYSIHRRRARNLWRASSTGAFAVFIYSQPRDRRSHGLLLGLSREHGILFDVELPGDRDITSLAHPIKRIASATL